MTVLSSWRLGGGNDTLVLTSGARLGGRLRVMEKPPTLANRRLFCACRGSSARLRI